MGCGLGRSQPEGDTKAWSPDPLKPFSLVLSPQARKIGPYITMAAPSEQRVQNADMSCKETMASLQEPRDEVQKAASEAYCCKEKDVMIADPQQQVAAPEQNCKVVMACLQEPRDELQKAASDACCCKEKDVMIADPQQQVAAPEQNCKETTASLQEPLDELQKAASEAYCCKEKDVMIADPQQQVAAPEQNCKETMTSLQEPLDELQKAASEAYCCKEKDMMIGTLQRQVAMLENKIRELEQQNYLQNCQLKSAVDHTMKLEELVRNKSEELNRMRKQSGLNLAHKPKDRRQKELDEMYLSVQSRSATQQETINRSLHGMEESIQQSMEVIICPKDSKLYKACMRYSQGYKDWELGYGIILCAVLQLCYEVCTIKLSDEVVHDAVRAYKAGRLCAPEVVAMLKDSLANDGSGVLADTACHLVAHSFSVNACSEQNNSRRYAAVYSLITAYLKNPVQDYLASAKQAVLADSELGFVAANPCVEEFVKKVLPSCWELATMYMPPIFACDQNVKVNGALHDLSQVSSRMGMVQSYLFPLVYYCGEVQRKARVLAEMP